MALKVLSFVVLENFTEFLKSARPFELLKTAPRIASISPAKHSITILKSFSKAYICRNFYFLVVEVSLSVSSVFEVKIAYIIALKKPS